MSTILGLPINGDITRSNRKDQRPQAEFTPIIEAALAVDGLRELRWVQYTPYFNDGDPCVFSCHGLRTLTIDAGEGEAVEVDVDGMFPGYDEEAEAVLGTWKWQYDHEIKARVRVGEYVGPDQARFEALEALDRALQSGEFDNVLLDLFGDHADVRVVVGDAVYIESVEHD